VSEAAKRLAEGLGVSKEKAWSGGRRSLDDFGYGGFGLRMVQGFCSRAGSWVRNKEGGWVKNS